MCEESLPISVKLMISFLPQTLQRSHVWINASENVRSQPGNCDRCLQMGHIYATCYIFALFITSY